MGGVCELDAIATLGGIPSAHLTRGRFAWCFPCFWYFYIFGFTPDVSVSLNFPGSFHLYGAIEVDDGSITD